MSVQEENQSFQALDSYTETLLTRLSAPPEEGPGLSGSERDGIGALAARAREGRLTGPIIDLFAALAQAHDKGTGPGDLGLSTGDLRGLAARHQEIDEHMVSVGGRLTQALPIAGTANARITEYLEKKGEEAPSGIEMWDQIQENTARIKRELKMTDDDWNSFSGQIRNAVFFF